jgi:serine/threonine protein kinase
MNPTGNHDQRIPGRVEDGSSEPASLEDPRAIQAVQEYLAALEAGQKPDRREFARHYPEIAEALAECLEGLELVHAAAPPPGPHGPAERADTPAATELLPDGRVDDYRIVREVGRGGMGVVYEAVQLSLGRRVALKVLPLATTLDRKQLQRFQNEAQTAACLHHSNIVPVFAVGCERGVYFYAMQFIDGQPLTAVIRELRQAAGREAGPPGQEPPAAAQPSVAEGPGSAEAKATLARASLWTERPSKGGDFFRTAARLGVQAAEALEHAHGLGVVHRDVKPGNLLLDVRGHLWVTDFGLAHVQGDASLTLTGDLVGTLRYMSPEQALARRGIVDHRTDVYSLGVTLFELLTLRQAFGGRDRQEVLRQIAFEEPRAPRQLHKAIPVELETIVLKAAALAKLPEVERHVWRKFWADVEDARAEAQGTSGSEEKSHKKPE